MLSNMLREQVSLIKKDGRVVDKIKAAVTPGLITMADASLPIEEGDTIERVLPNGITERYNVVDTGFHAQFHSIPAHYQTRVEKQTGRPAQQASPVIYNVTGANARVVVQSTDNSTNVVSTAPAELFELMAVAIRQGVPSVDDQNALLARVRDLENAKEGPSFLVAYQKLIATAADHVTILTPFLPALAQLASN